MGLQESKISRATKTQDVKYKEKEIAALAKRAANSGTDRSGLQVELDAVLEYLAKLNDQCVAKPETYAERSGRREAEIAGLKDALKILEGNAALLQRKRSRSRDWGSLRGAVVHLTPQ